MTQNPFSDRASPCLDKTERSSANRTCRLGTVTWNSLADPSPNTRQTQMEGLSSRCVGMLEVRMLSGLTRPSAVKDRFRREGGIPPRGCVHRDTLQWNGDPGCWTAAGRAAQMAASRKNSTNKSTRLVSDNERPCAVWPTASRGHWPVEYTTYIPPISRDAVDIRLPIIPQEGQTVVGKIYYPIWTDASRPETLSTTYLNPRTW